MVYSMSRQNRHSHLEEDINIWPAFTDLMSNAFMILSFLLLLTLFKSLFLQSNESKLKQEIKRLKAPPVLIIKDSDDRKFSSGSAELPPKLRDYITNNLIDKIEKITQETTQEYEVYVIEVIGHTDGQVNGNIPSNLDNNLESVAKGKKSVSNLQAGSNADLGLMRALEVVKTLQEIQKTGRLKGLQFRAYSAAQLLLTNGEFASINRQPDGQRRRIEIRFSPLGKAEEIK